jgi:hypothetical protein
MFELALLILLQAVQRPKGCYLFVLWHYQDLCLCSVAWLAGELVTNWRRFVWRGWGEPRWNLRMAILQWRGSARIKVANEGLASCRTNRNIMGFNILEVRHHVTISVFFSSPSSRMCDTRHFLFLIHYHPSILSNMIWKFEFEIWIWRKALTFRRRIKSRLPFAGIIRSSPYSARFQDKG